MINPKAIDAFIRASRDDWRWIKKATMEELREEFDNVPVHTAPYLHQWASIALGVANPNFMFFLDMGLGKAQSVDEPVLTPTGWVRMGDLQPGDYVVGADGLPTEVLKVHPQGVLDLMLVTFSDGSQTTCCNDHLWATSTEIDLQGKPVYKTRDLYSIRDTLLNADGIPQHRIPMTAAVAFGDAAEAFDIERRYDAVKCPVENPYCPSPSEESVVPPWTLLDTVEYRLKYLKTYLQEHGMILADASLCIDRHRSADFADLQQLVWSLGGAAIWKDERLYLEIPRQYNILPKSSPNYHIGRIRQQNSEPMRVITDVEYVGQSEAQCITVANPDGLYLTRNFIVTHNTKLLLDLFMHRKNRGEAKRMLVLVPNATNVQSWVDEIAVHQPNLRGIGLEGTAKQRKDLLEADADVWIINYQGLQSLATTVVNRKRMLDEKAIVDVAQRFDMIGMDEIHKCKNPESLTFELCDYLCDAATYRYGLTGTPFGRNPMDLWAQFFLIDRGASLGNHPQLFKETFFNKTMNNAGFVDWEFDKRKKRLLNRMIQHRSIRYRDTEAQDLPSQVFKQVRVRMGKDAARYAREMLEEIQERAMAGDLEDRQQQENTFIKMRTLASGFVRVYELDEDGKKTKHYDDVIFKEQPKLEAVVDLLESLPEDEKLVIFHEFIATGTMIEGALKKAKIKYLALNAATKDKKAFLHKFRDDDSYRVAVVNSKSGSTGLNLQRANHMCFFESPVSPIDRQQAEKRTHRGGQKKKCFYYDLITINSVDERIQEFLKEGKDLMAAIVEQPEKGGGLLASMMGDFVEAEGGAKKTKKAKKTK